MVDESIINTLKGYSSTFKKCSWPKSANSKHYGMIYANLYLLASAMEDVRHFYKIEPDTLGIFLKSDALDVSFILARERYEYITKGDAS